MSFYLTFFHFEGIPNGHIVVLKSMIENLSKEARRKEFRKEEEKRLFYTLLTETSTHLQQHIKRRAQSDQK